MITHIDYVGTFALFRIDRDKFRKMTDNINILVAQEGNWLTREGMSCCWNIPMRLRISSILKHKMLPHRFENYEDIQKYLGRGLTFVGKEYSGLLNRTMVKFAFDDSTESEKYILAVPATGEEINFEIYGFTRDKALILILSREL